MNPGDWDLLSQVAFWTVGTRKTKLAAWEFGGPRFPNREAADRYATTLRGHARVVLVVLGKVMHG